MKHQLTVLLALSILISCNDEETPSNCRLIESYESQDYENGGEKLKYEFNFNDELLSQMNKLVLIDDVYHLFYSDFYQYDNQGHLIRVDQRDSNDKLLNFTELTYNNDLLVSYVAQSAATLSREQRIILYDANNTINKVTYSFYKGGETEAFDSFYITLNYNGEEVTVSYFDAQDQFTGSIDISVSTLPITNNPLPLFFERYYGTPLYLLPSVPTRLEYKDANGNITGTLSYDYTLEGGSIRGYKLHQGIRSDMFEFNYVCN